jgi:predicted alpha/beta-hydrolase family hydrolase
MKLNLNHTHPRNKPFKAPEAKPLFVVNVPTIVFRGKKQNLGTSASGIGTVKINETI